MEEKTKDRLIVLGIGTVSGILSGIILQALNKHGGKMIKSLFQTYIVEMWPMWGGLLVACLYWLIRDYIKLRSLKKWIGFLSHRDSKTGKIQYKNLKGKIKLYIDEELEKHGLIERSKKS